MPSTKKVSVPSRNYGNKIITVDSENAKVLETGRLSITSFGGTTPQLAVRLISKGRRPFLHRLLFKSTGKRFRAKDGNLLNCTKKNIIPIE
jgi:hypothetical protein